MIRFILFVAVILLFLGPLRRPFVSNRRYIIPLALGAIIGFFFAVLFVRYGAPPLILIVGPVLGMFTFGSALKDSFDKFFK